MSFRFALYGAHGSLQIGTDGSQQIGTDGSLQIGTDSSLQILELAGREEWALSHLLAAGTHGRYVLRSKVVKRLGAMEMAT
jgi:hypothetical protein